MNKLGNSDLQDQAEKKKEQQKNAIIEESEQNEDEDKSGSNMSSFKKERTQVTSPVVIKDDEDESLLFQKKFIQSKLQTPKNDKTTTTNTAKVPPRNMDTFFENNMTFEFDGEEQSVDMTMLQRKAVNDNDQTNMMSFTQDQPHLIEEIDESQFTKIKLNDEDLQSTGQDNILGKSNKNTDKTIFN